MFEGARIVLSFIAVCLVILALYVSINRSDEIKEWFKQHSKKYRLKQKAERYNKIIDTKGNLVDLLWSYDDFMDTLKTDPEMFAKFDKDLIVYGRTGMHPFKTVGFETKQDLKEYHDWYDFEFNTTFTDYPEDVDPNLNRSNTTDYAGTYCDEVISLGYFRSCFDNNKAAKEGTFHKTYFIYKDKMYGFGSIKTVQWYYDKFYYPRFLAEDNTENK